MIFVAVIAAGIIASIVVDGRRNKLRYQRQLELRQRKLGKYHK